MAAQLEGVVLGVDAESVKTDRLEHLCSPHALIAPEGIRPRVLQDVADVEALCRRVGELDQVVEEPRRVYGIEVDVVEAGLLPPLAPALLDLAEVTGDAHRSGPSLVMVRLLSPATKNLLPGQEVFCGGGDARGQVRSRSTVVRVINDQVTA